MTLNEFVTAHRVNNTRGGNLIVPRCVAGEHNKYWARRIVGMGLPGMGAKGADRYLAVYGKGIAAPKCIALALLCENEGATELAQGFWAKAYELTTGHSPMMATQPKPEPAKVLTPSETAEAAEIDWLRGVLSPAPLADAAWVEHQTPINTDDERRRQAESQRPAPDGFFTTPDPAPVEIDAAERLQLRDTALSLLRDNPQITFKPDFIATVTSDFPAHLQPGKVETMQPTDAIHDVEFYIANSRYWGQPKKDGHRMLIFGEHSGVRGQKRSLAVVSPLPAEIEEPLFDLVMRSGPFILDGELTYLDTAGKEHRTAAQAVTANLALGKGTVPPQARYCIFSALYAKGEDLTAKGQTTTSRMMAAHILYHAGPEGKRLADNKHFELLGPRRSTEGKRLLLEQQALEGREGVIFMDAFAPWTPGKISLKAGGEPMVRVKFTKTLDVIVTALRATTVKGRAFSAIEVATWEKGDGTIGSLRPRGRIGTGFTLAQTQEIAAAFAANPELVIEVETRGFTESGSVYQASFHSIRADKRPEDCQLEA